MGIYHKPGFWRSLNQAWRGTLYSARTQKHVQFHLVAGFGVLLSAWYCEVTQFEWLILIFAIGSVISTEVMNTAVEIVVDMVQPNFHPLAGMAKDVAAGAVLVASIQAAVIGIIVFAPALHRFASRMF